MQQNQSIVLFDGKCNLCSSVVQFLIRQDKYKRLRYAPMQSEKGEALLKNYGFPHQYLKSFVLIEGSGSVFKKSTAALKLFGKLPWYWRWTQMFWVIPKFLRDPVYEFISRNRTKWFGRSDQCMLPAPGHQDRFL